MLLALLIEELEFCTTVSPPTIVSVFDSDSVPIVSECLPNTLMFATYFNNLYALQILLKEFVYLLKIKLFKLIEIYFVYLIFSCCDLEHSCFFQIPFYEFWSYSHSYYLLAYYVKLENLKYFKIYFLPIQ